MHLSGQLRFPICKSLVKHGTRWIVQFRTAWRILTRYHLSHWKEDISNLIHTASHQYLEQAIVHNLASWAIPITYDTWAVGGFWKMSADISSSYSSSKSDSSSSETSQSSSRIRDGNPSAADVCWSRTYSCVRSAGIDFVDI
jgi:hypothetical protein